MSISCWRVTHSAFVKDTPLLSSRITQSAFSILQIRIWATNISDILSFSIQFPGDGAGLTVTPSSDDKIIAIYSEETLLNKRKCREEEENSVKAIGNLDAVVRLLRQWRQKKSNNSGGSGIGSRSTTSIATTSAATTTVIATTTTITVEPFVEITFVRPGRVFAVRVVVSHRARLVLSHPLVRANLLLIISHRLHQIHGRIPGANL